MFLDSKFVVDYSEEDRAGAALIVLSNLIVLDQGSKGDGCLAWCSVATPVGPVSIASIYAPNERARRRDIWDWMSTHLHYGNWIFRD